MEPLRRALSGLDAWMTGLRREHRLHAPPSPKSNGTNNKLIKINPLAEWTHDDVWNYIREHNVPYNALHDRGYPSIGCGRAPAASSLARAKRRPLVVGHPET